MGVEGQAIVLDAKISLTNINPVNCLGWAVSREMPKTSYIATGHLRGEPLGGGGGTLLSILCMTQYILVAV